MNHVSRTNISFSGFQTIINIYAFERIVIILLNTLKTWSHSTILSNPQVPFSRHVRVKFPLVKPGQLLKTVSLRVVSFRLLKIIYPGFVWPPFGIKKKRKFYKFLTFVGHISFNNHTVHIKFKAFIPGLLAIWHFMKLVQFFTFRRFITKSTIINYSLIVWFR